MKLILRNLRGFLLHHTGFFVLINASATMPRST